MGNRLCAAGLALLLGAAAPALAQNTWFVDELGSDGTGDGSSGNPWATFSHAFAQSGIADGDTIQAIGTISDSFTIDHEVSIFFDNIIINGLNSANGHGIEIQADNVFLSGSVFVDTSAVSGGTMLYAADPNDGVLENFQADFLAIWAAESASEFPPPAGSGKTLMEVVNPSDSAIYQLVLKPSSATPPEPTASPDDGLVVRGATPGGSSGLGLTLESASIQSLTDSLVDPEVYPAGVGISLQPGPSTMLDGVYATLCNTAFSLTTGIEIRDELTGANEGITNVELERNVAYFNLNGFAVHGIANDSGAGISNVLIHGNDSTYNTTSNYEAGYRFSQTGTGTSNIDFSTVLLRGNAIFNNNDATSYAVLNEIPGTTVDAAYNIWGEEDPEVGQLSADGNRISTGVDIDPAFVGPYGGDLFHGEAPAAGDSISLGGLTGLVDTQVDIDFNTGQTDEFAFARAGYSTYPGGTAGFVGGAWGGSVISVLTDAPDGSYVMLLQYRYSEFNLGQVGIAEEDYVLFYYNPNTITWEPAVEGNTQGTPSWEGDAPVPSSVTVADLGRHGVDTANNIAWAVVDHTTDYAGGQGNNGQGEPASVPEWSLY